MKSERYWTRIQSPGKFEGEPVLARYLWKKSLDWGLAGFRVGSHYCVPVEVTPVERERWGLEKDVTALLLSESDTGFVSMISVNAEDLAKLEVEQDTEDES